MGGLETYADEYLTGADADEEAGLVLAYALGFNAIEGAENFSSLDLPRLGIRDESSKAEVLSALQRIISLENNDPALESIFKDLQEALKAERGKAVQDLDEENDGLEDSDLSRAELIEEFRAGFGAILAWVQS